MKINSANLKILRVRKGLRQDDLAKKAGTTQAMISHLENGIRGGCMPLLAENIASVLECNCEDITGQPSVWSKFMRNCKLLSYEQMEALNSVVVQMIKGSDNF